MTVTLKGKLPLTGLDQAAVSVNFQQQKANNVLSVPVTALLATAGGGYAVQQAASPHKLLPVTPGLFAAGIRADLRAPTSTPACRSPTRRGERAWDP